MKYSEFVEIVTILDKEKQIRDAWLCSVPRDINEAFFDNTYVNSLYKENTFLKEKLIPHELQFDVDWFLYEVDREYGSTAIQNNKPCNIKTLEDFLELIKTTFDFEAE